MEVRQFMWIIFSNDYDSSSNLLNFQFIATPNFHLDFTVLHGSSVRMHDKAETAIVLNFVIYLLKSAERNDACKLIPVYFFGEYSGGLGHCAEGLSSCKKSPSISEMPTKSDRQKC